MARNDSILILTTGGTIDKQYFDALNRYQIGGTTVIKDREKGCFLRKVAPKKLR